MHFAVAAVLQGGVRIRAAQSVDAETPLAAARKHYWRLDAGQRGRCLRVTVGPHTPPRGATWPCYAGPVMSYAPHQGWRLLSRPTSPPENDR